MKNLLLTVNYRALYVFDSKSVDFLKNTDLFINRNTNRYNDKYNMQRN